VTGAARGIGRAIVDAFAAEGAAVFAVDVDAAGLGTLAKGRSEAVTTLVANLGNPAEAKGVIAAAVERMGRIHVLVNNAAVMPERPILEIGEAEWREVWSVNVEGPFWATQAVARHMIESGGGGAVVNIASTNAFRVESPEAHYNASKAAVVVLTRSFAHELGHHGIRFNCVAPGETVTDEEAASMSRERAADQAAAVLFLASDEASFVNGHTLVVDGGELTGDWFDPADRPKVPRQWFE
jgi:NAD(P)-dependent dehydrogenase (short-subunit alcohol dehydrogenase family)